MPYRILFHNGDSEEAYALVKTTRELRSAIHKMVEHKEDDWYSGDTISVLKITEVEAANEVFWDDLTEQMRRKR